MADEQAEQAQQAEQAEQAQRLPPMPLLDYATARRLQRLLLIGAALAEGLPESVPKSDEECVDLGGGGEGEAIHLRKLPRVSIKLFAHFRGAWKLG